MPGDVFNDDPVVVSLPTSTTPSTSLPEDDRDPTEDDDLVGALADPNVDSVVDLSGLISAEDVPGPNIVAEHAGGQIYSDADIDGRIDWDMGVLALPVCGPVGTAPVIIQVHAPVAWRAVEWTAGRKRERPRIPASDTKNDYEVVTGKTVFTNTPAMDTQGNLIHRVSGRYEYAFLRPPTKIDKLPMGVPPYNSLAAADLRIDPEDFDDRLLDDANLVVSDLTAPEVQAQLDLANYDLYDYVGP